jgi:sarcosine oxidase, subunit alpha
VTVAIDGAPHLAAAIVIPCTALVIGAHIIVVLLARVSRRLPLSSSDRGQPVELSISGSAVRAFSGESVAAAALASGVRILSRSLKYHRPRTFFCLEGHCGGCLVRIGGVPNLRACQMACQPALEIEGQNAFPSTEMDLLGAVDFLFSRGMDHHTLMTSSSMLNHLANRVVRQLSGLGKLPSAPAQELPPVAEHHVDVAVIGGGPAGLAAATATARAGARTLLVDDQLQLGGSLRADPRFGPDAANRAAQEAVEAGATLAGRTTAIAYFPEDAGGVLVTASDAQLGRVFAKQWIWATGGYPVNLPVPDNDRPGVIALRAAGRLLVDHGILAGDRICVIAAPRMGEDADATASALRAAGADVTVVQQREVDRVRGRGWVSGVDLEDGRRIDCDLVAMAAIPSPASEGPRQQGCQVELSAAGGGFALVVNERGRTSRDDAWACGDVCGYQGPAAAAAHGARVGAAVVEALAEAAARSEALAEASTVSSSLSSSLSSPPGA